MTKSIQCVWKCYCILSFKGKWMKIFWYFIWTAFNLMILVYFVVVLKDPHKYQAISWHLGSLLIFSDIQQKFLTNLYAWVWWQWRRKYYQKHFLCIISNCTRFCFIRVYLQNAIASRTHPPSGNIQKMFRWILVSLLFLQLLWMGFKDK